MGLIFAYLGPGEPPLLPAYEALTAPAGHQAVLKLYQECSYLQANEGNIDPIHLSYLHRQFAEPSQYEQRWDLGVRGSEASANSLYGADLAPTVQAEETDFGLQIFSIRAVGPAQTYLRVSNFIMPNCSAVPAGTGAGGYNLNWAVPINDTHH